MARPSTTTDTILDSIQAGTVFARSDLYDVLSSSQVSPALTKLAKDGDVVSLGHGLWYVPTSNPLLRRKASGPTVDSIVQALARTTGNRFLPGEMYAANRLGLVNPVGVRPLYLTDCRIGEKTTDAETRERVGANVAKFGDREIHLRYVPKSRLAWAGRPAATVVQAAHYLVDLDPKWRKTKKHVADLQRIVEDNPEIAADLREGIGLLKGDAREMIAPILRAIADREESPDAVPAKPHRPPTKPDAKSDPAPDAPNKRASKPKPLAPRGPVVRRSAPRTPGREPTTPEEMSHGLR